MPSPPVLVAGAGPVGLAAALLLAAYRVPTVVVEARASQEPSGSRPGSRAICMQRDVLDLLDRVAGIGSVLAREGVTWRRGVTYYREHALFETTFPEAGASAYPPFVNISQSRTEELLLAAAAAQPLVDLRWDSPITGLHQDDAGVRVEVTGPAGVTEVRGSHLVAADGSRSQVRRLLGVPFTGFSFADQFLIADIRAELPFPSDTAPVRRFFFDPPWNPGRQVLVHPQPDSVWRIDWQVPDDFDLAAERASGALDARIRRIVGDADYELVWLSAYRFSRRLAERFVEGRVLLAGDAAHLMSPFGARGLNSGLQDAENAAWKLAYLRHGWAGPGLLASYDIERRAAAEENLRVTDATMRFLVPGSEQEWAHRRDVLERAVTDPAAAAEIDSGTLAEPFWYADSPLTTPPSRPAGPGEPGADRAPVPGVLCPDGPVLVPGRPEVTRLRHLVGPTFVVLACGADPAAVAAATRAIDGTLPVDVLRLDDIDVAGVLAPSLDARPGTVHVVRPDGHLAAVLPTADPEPVVGALRRALALGPPAGSLSRPWSADTVAASSAQGAEQDAGAADADQAALLARRCAETMYAADVASRQLGITISDVAPGRATARMTVSEIMIQGHGSCHGGYLFTLADSAFAFACNTYGTPTVAAACDITFVAPVGLGDGLVAQARERVRYGRSGVYDVTVRRASDDAVVAEFRGHSRTVRAALPPP